MPFEKFKPPKLHGVIGSQVGKMNGVVLSKGLTATSKAANSLRKAECPSPAELAQISTKLAGLANLSGAMSNNLSAFTALPASIKGPVSGILAVVKTIIKLPIPQAIGIPPGPAGGLIIGLPTAFTTNFADILNLMKEFAIAMTITADSIEGVLKSVSNSTASMNARVSDIAPAIAVCKICNTAKAKLTKPQLQALGIIDAAGNNILDGFGASVLQEENTDSPKGNIEKDLAKKMNLAVVALKGSKSIGDFPSAGAKLNIMKEGDAFRLPVEKNGDKVVNKFAVITATGDISKAGVPIKKVKVVELDINSKGLTGKAKAFRQIDTVLRNISDTLSKTDTSDSRLRDSKLNENQKNKSGNRLNEFDNFSKDINIDPNSANNRSNSKNNNSGTLGRGTNLDGTRGTNLDGTRGTNLDGTRVNNLDATRGSNLDGSRGSNLDGSRGSNLDATNSLRESIGKIKGNITDSIPLEVLRELKDELSKLNSPLVQKESTAAEESSETFYKGFNLKIQRTPESPVLAPRHFASALKNGKIVIKGPNSYSSSKEVLLEEIKFRIDNQLS